MRIDIVTDTFTPDINGVAMTLGRLTEGMRQRGHAVHVIRTGSTDGQRGQTEVRSVPLPGYTEIRIGLPSPFKLRRRWSKRRPDAIYVATESPLGRSAISAAASLGLPVVAGFHTNFDEYMAKYRLRGLQSAAVLWLRHIHNRADMTLAPSAEVVKRLVDDGFNEVRLLGRGVDTGLFDPAKRCELLRAQWGARPGVPVVAVVGRVAAEKNLELATEALRRMRTEVCDMRCVIIGDGPLRERMQAAHPDICFAGVQQGESLAAHYASADILLFPSETETFGNVLIEGLASGLVTVSYDYAAAAAHVRHRENGLKAPKGDAEAWLAEAVRAADLGTHDNLREAARRSVENLSWSGVVCTFESYLEAAVAAKRGRMTATGFVGKRHRKDGKLHVRTVFISDVHLGSPDSKAREAVDFLKHVKCAKLVLNGDIIDAWSLRRGAKWSDRHTKFVRTVLKMSEKDDVEVIYLRGNHDDVLDRFLPLAFGPIKFVREHIHESITGKHYLVVHGDGFDSVSSHHRWLAMAGSVGYDLLLYFNRIYNRWRAWRGHAYFSLSQKIKARVKSAVSYIDRYEIQLQQLALHRHCEGIICGHIHTPEDRQVGDVHYLNSGDWVESLSAVVEHLDGRFELIHYEDFLESIADTPEPHYAPMPPAAAKLRSHPRQQRLAAVFNSR
ncbi:MAG: glycosyltransferase [Verrucomicrobia bacterium]|nr:glycosyltransferase [Verrucomicrobiota bacterium]